MKIIEYKTAGGCNLIKLDEAVNKFLAQGYQLFGNPYNGGGFVGQIECSTPDGKSSQCYFFQAMVMDIETAGKIEKAKAEIAVRKKQKSEK